MGRFVRGQQVFIISTGEIDIVIRKLITREDMYFTKNGTHHKSDMLPFFEIWQQNTILDVGAKSLKELPAADKAARIANRAIERMINQSPPI